MIDMLYDKFKDWSAKGSVYLFSDPHFNDADCKIMNPKWIEADEQVQILNKYAHKSDTLIILGDVGDIDYIKKLKAGRKVLIMGNHDTGANKYKEVFDEVYEGALFISEKILLSHEPIEGLPFAVNIHGHVHNGRKIWNDESGAKHINLAADVIDYTPVSLKELIKSGAFASAKDIHRITIDRAVERKVKWDVVGMK